MPTVELMVRRGIPQPHLMKLNYALVKDERRKQIDQEGSTPFLALPSNFR